MGISLTWTDGRPKVVMSHRDAYAGMVHAVNTGCWRHAELLARALLRDATPRTPRKWLGQAAGVVARCEVHGTEATR